jgi:hypothetical protein
MEKSTKYAVISLAVLFLGILGVGGAYLRSRIEASQISAEQADTAALSGETPIKFGPNELTNGPKSIYLDSEVILTNDGLVSIAKAQREGTILEVKTSEGKIMGQGAERILPNENFSLNAGKVVGQFGFYPESL